MRRNLILSVLIMLILVSCGGDKRTKIDVSNIEIDARIKRLDKDIFEIDLGNVAESVTQLENQYGDFFQLYNSLVVKLGKVDAPDYAERLTMFVTDYHMNKAYSRTQEIFPNLDVQEQKIGDAFKRFKYFFPEKNVPALYSFIGGFNQSIVVADNILGIGLDKYLGSDCVFYDRLGTPEYLQKKMTPEMIPIDALKSWLLTEFVYNDSVDNVVNNMVYQGKVQYALKSMFPNEPDSLLVGFDSNQINWCIQNEKHMWDYLIDEKLLFSTDYMLINQLINPAPFTNGFPKQSPGRACVWLGEKIVSAYMNRNKNVSLNDLMLDDNYQKILSESRYEP